jgi:hypothetical protein
MIEVTKEQLQHWYDQGYLKRVAMELGVSIPTARKYCVLAGVPVGKVGRSKVVKIVKGGS